MNVEVQKYRSEAHQRRVRYHGALLTANYTPQGGSFSEVPNVCIIYIAKFDIFGAEQSVYHIKRTVEETGQTVYNGMEEIYVNTEIRDGTEISELMRVFTEDAAYSERFPVTSKLKRLYREEAPEMIYTEWDKYRDEMIKVGEEKGREEGRAEERNQLSHLFACLKQAGRLDDFAKAMEDPEYCNVLMTEFSI